jgi:hypothetical protein
MTQDTNLPIKKAGCCSTGGCACQSRKGFDAVAFTAALLISGVLGFAALAKFTGPNPNEKIPGTDFLLDYAVAGVEVIVILGLLALHRVKYVWLLTAIMFAGFYTALGRSCGCFGKLWTPPLGVTLAIDIAFVFLSLAMAKRRGAKLGLILPTLAIAGLACFAGYKYADNKPRAETTQVQYENKDAPQRLLESALLADLRDMPAGAPAYYIFLYDPDCHVCEEMKPIVEMDAGNLDSSADADLQVRMYSIPELETQLGIERWAWMGTPSVVVIKDGQVLRNLAWNDKPSPWFGEGTPYPNEVKSLLVPAQ